MDTQRSKQTWFDQLGLAANSGRSAGAAEPREGLRRTAMVMLIILVLLGPLMTFGGVNLTEDGAVERQIGYVVILALTIYSVMPVATRASFVAAPVPVLIAFGWCWLSLAWSIDPTSTLRRVVLTTTVALSMFLLVRHSSYRAMIDVVRWCLVGAIAVSYLVVLLAPATGVHMMLDSAMPTALVGNWRGFLGHKNFAGAVCALCIMLFVFDAKRFSATVRIAVIVMAAYFLYRSQSKTSAGMLVLAIVTGAMFETLNRRLRAFLVPIVTVLGSIGWLATSAYADTLKTNFLDPTAFTGRGQIWSVLLSYAREHPWLGAGFGAFWNIGGLSPVFTYGRGYVTEITVGHSGYIDQLVAVGLPGMLLMVYSVMIWPLWKLLSRNDILPQRGALIAAMLVFCIGHNVTESGLFERDAIMSTIMFLTAALAQHGGDGERARSARRNAGDDLLKKMRERQAPAASA